MKEVNLKQYSKETLQKAAQELKKEGLVFNINKEILDDQKTVEVSTEIPEKAKVESEDKQSFKDFKTVCKGQIDEKCLADFGTLEDEKLWEDTAKELFLTSKEYIPEEDIKTQGELGDKLEESKEVKTNNFNEIDFESNIPHVMRYKRFRITENNNLYWVTQEFFKESDVQKFAEAFKNTNLNKAYVTVRDLSTYDVLQDRAENNLVIVNSDGSYDMTGYLQACKKANYDVSLYEAKEIKVGGNIDTPAYKDFQSDMELIEQGLKTDALSSPEAIEIAQELNDVMNQRWISIEQNKFGVKYESKKTEEWEPEKLELGDDGLPVLEKPYKMSWNEKLERYEISSIHPYDLTDYYFATSTGDNYMEYWRINSPTGSRVDIVEGFEEAVNALKEFDSKLTPHMNHI